ncbi:MAG: squalene/phytoene synthase family protein [Alphaproteobacteria bacterium]|nr:squalene/phytoene synthase family protein [Alphaproteobacteria bacterium]
MAHSLSYCGDFVRQSDPDRFLLSMFAPADRREALWALFAFQGEIAKTRDVVSDSTLGRMRLQWWRDELEKIYAGHEAPAHEVLAPLAAAIRVHDLPLADFEMLLEAREFDLGDELPGNVEGFLNYADLTTTPLMRMAVQIEGCDPALEPVQAVAMNYALAGLLRVIPHWAGHGRCVLPEDVMAAYGITPGGLFTGKNLDGLAEMVRFLARERVAGIKPGSKLLRATDVLAGLYFRQMERVSYDVLSPRMAIDPAFKVLRLTFFTKFM